MIGLHEACHLVEIREKQPGHPVILLDGCEIRTAVAATLTLGVDRPPQLKVALLALDGMDVTVQARVMVDEETAAALVAMGWAPPGT